MLTIYKSPRKKCDSFDSDSDSSTIIIPAGRPYLTKVKGKLVMAREKRDKTADIVLDLLGEAFGANKPKVIHRSRATSLEPPAQRLLIGEVPYVPQQQLTYSTPIPRQPFLQFLPHHPSGVVPLQPQYPVQPPTYMIPHPSERDLEQLRLISTHFETMHGRNLGSLGSNKKEETTKPPTTITKHMCAQCGRLRSRKYHHDNPIQLGETPTPGYCRKCQRDTSSTSGGDSDRESEKLKNKGANKKSKNKGKGKTSKQKAVEISDRDDHNECTGDETGQSPVPKKPEDLKSSKENARGYKRVPSENYIIVEEEHSEEEQRPRGRGRTKVQERVIEEYVNQYPLTHLGSQLTARNRSPSRSTTKGQRFELPRKQVSTSQMNEPLRSSLPPIQYRYVERVPSHNFVNVYSKKVPNRFVEEEEELYYSKPKEAVAREEVRYSKSSYPSEEYIVEVTEEFEPVSIISSKDHRHSKVIDTNSRHTSQNSERRKQRRGDGESSSNRNRETWHEIHPQYYDKITVESERSKYGHQNNRDYEEERRVQERLDRDILNFRGGSRESHNVRVKDDSKDLEEDSAHRYYHDDWSRVEPEKISNRRGYRRDRRQDSNFSDSEASLLYNKNGVYNPRVPSPPSAISSRRPVHPPYRLRSDSEARNVRSRSLTPTGNLNSSGEQFSVLSPRGHSNRSYSYDESEILGLSHLTENETAVEEETRKRVTFRNTPSERSFSEVDSEWRIEDPQDAEPILFPSETGFADGGVANSWVEGGTNLW